MVMRRFIDLLAEKYTSDNADLLRYLKNDTPDPYGIWHAICQWLDENGRLDDVAEQIGEEIPDADALEEMDAEVFFKLDDELQNEAMEGAKNWLYQYAPEEAPTRMHADLRSDRLLPRTTWLIHFSDEADAISYQGFKIGVSDMDRLGLTTNFRNDGDTKRYGGYNFAFLAGDRMAAVAARTRKYGRNAVMFQNSGVHTFHIGDTENQIIFWGKDVDPKSIIVLKQDDGDWYVEARREVRNGSDVLYRGKFEDVVNWVIRNHQQYRRYL